jgi:hypothetical protein
MPSPIVDQDIAGDGIVTFAVTADVLFMLCRLDTLGPDVRELEASAPDHVLRAGWLTLGDQVTAFGETHNYWRKPIFLDFATTLWTTEPSRVGATDGTLLASRIRWHLSVGTHGHLYVFG